MLLFSKRSFWSRNSVKYINLALGEENENKEIKIEGIKVNNAKNVIYFLLALEPLTSTSIFKEFLTSEKIIKKRSINNIIFPINNSWRLSSDNFKKLLSINVKKVTKPTNKVIKNITMINIFFFIKSIIVDKIMCYIFLS